MSPCCTKDVMQYYYFALEWFFLHWYVCTCGVKLPVFFLLQKRISETCFLIFGYNARSMRNNRLIARGSNTSNTFCRDKTYLGVEVTTRMGIDWNIYLIINERCKTDQKLHINIFIFMINYQCYIGCRGYRLCHHNYNLETLMDWYLAPFLVHKAKS